MTTKVGLMLVAENIISRAQLEEALAAKLGKGGTIGSHLISLGYVDEGFLVNYYCRKFKLPYADDALFKSIAPAILGVVPVEMVGEFSVIPLAVERDTLFLAMADPSTTHALDEIGFFTGYAIRPMVAKDSTIAAAMRTLYGIGADEKRPPPDSAANAVALAETIKAPVQKPGDGAQDDTSPVLKPIRLNEPWTPGSDLLRSQTAREGTSPFSVDRTGDKPEPRDETQAATDARTTPKPKGDEVEDTETEGTWPGIGGVRRRGTTHVGPVSADMEPAPSLEVALRQLGEAIAPQPTGVSAHPVAATTNASRAVDAKVRAAVREAATRLATARDRMEIARAIEACVMTIASRMALFVVRQNLVVGWHAHGGGLGPERVRAIMFPQDAPSTFARVLSTHASHVGHLQGGEVDDALVEALGGTPPRDVLVVPIAVHGRIVSLLYCESDGTPSPLSAARPAVEELAAEVATSFERAIQQARGR